MRLNAVEAPSSLSFSGDCSAISRMKGSAIARDGVFGIWYFSGPMDSRARRKLMRQVISKEAFSSGDAIHHRFINSGVGSVAPLGRPANQTDCTCL